MPDQYYRDLLIQDGNFVVDAGRQPQLVYARACIAQDIVHEILESGLLVQLIGNRREMDRKTIMVRISLMVDREKRIKPGTTRLYEHWESRNTVKYEITAETLRYGKISVFFDSAGNPVEV